MAGLTWLRRAFVSTFFAATAAACGGSDNGGGGPTGPSPGPGGAAATITITASGVSPNAVDISPGQRVEFVNADSRDHQIFTTPHNLHTDCPPINQIDRLTPGARRMTGELNVVRICGFHDHMDPTNNALRGVIRVGTATGPEPEY